MIRPLDHSVAPPSGRLGTHATFRACLTGQEKPAGPAIPTSSQNSSLTLQPGRARIIPQNHKSRIKTLPLSPSGGLVGFGEGRREPLVFPKNSVPKLPAGPQRHGGKMTAEVTLLNRSAVALAADSKVSIGSGIAEKTYDTVNKIFTLSKVHPVGIMIFGNADFMHFPWETIVKEYRQQKRNRAESTIETWANDFIRFVRGFGRLKKSDIASNISGILATTFIELEIEIYEAAHEQKLPVASKEFEDLVIEKLEERIRHCVHSGRFLTVAQVNKVANDYSKEILGAHAYFVQGRKNARLSDRALEFAMRALAHYVFSPQSSGIVVAGFGEREIFPATAVCQTDGYIGSRVKVSPFEHTRIGDSTRATAPLSGAVRAYAQADIVYRFMEGIDPHYGNVLDDLVSNTIVNSNLETFRKWAPKNRQTKRTTNAIANAARKLFKDIHDQAVAYRKDQFWFPTVQMVSLLPKDELANLAESLVALTSLHRKVSRELETVGGPIDVAVISKGDGFIWVKRKHYFKPELNPQFNLNYMRGMRRQGR
jgi:hypothetical protein